MIEKINLLKKDCNFNEKDLKNIILTIQNKINEVIDWANNKDVSDLF